MFKFACWRCSNRQQEIFGKAQGAGHDIATARIGLNDDEKPGQRAIAINISGSKY